MKKIILSVVVFAMTVVGVNAQVSYGVKAGVNFSNINGFGEDLDIVDYSSRTTFVGGVFAEIPLSEKFSFQPELLYSAQGAKQKINEVIAEEPIHYEGTFKLNYINIPAIFKYYVKDGLNIQAGLQLGFLLSAKNELNVKDIENEPVDVYDSMNPIDFSIPVGLGFKTKNGISIDARYTFGISNIWDTEGIVEDLDLLDNTNGIFQLTLGYVLK